jgi:hypothetical protein
VSNIQEIYPSLPANSLPPYSESFAEAAASFGNSVNDDAEDLMWADKTNEVGQQQILILEQEIAQLRLRLEQELEVNCRFVAVVPIRLSYESDLELHVV